MAGIVISLLAFNFESNSNYLIRIWKIDLTEINYSPSEFFL